MLSTAQLIKIARIKKNISQEDLAKKLDVSSNYISLIENGKKDPSINCLKAASEVLEIPFVLLIWEKIDLPLGKSKEEKHISIKMKGMLEEAQQLFANKTFGIK